MAAWHWGAASSRPPQPVASLRNMMAPTQHSLHLAPAPLPPEEGGFSHHEKARVEAYRKEGLLYHCQREVVDPEGGHSCLARPLLVPVGVVASVLLSPSGHSPAPRVMLLPVWQLLWHC